MAALSLGHILIESLTTLYGCLVAPPAYTHAIGPHRIGGFPGAAFDAELFAWIDCVTDRTHVRLR